MMQINKWLFVCLLLCSSSLWAGNSTPFEHLSLQQKLALTTDEFELSRSNYPGDWFPEAEHISAICLQGYPPLIKDHNLYYDLDIRSSLFQPELLPLSFLNSKQMSAGLYEEFDLYVRGQCSAMAGLKKAMQQLLREHVVSYQRIESDDGKYDWQLIVYKARPEYIDSLVVFSAGEILHRYQLDDPMDRFVSVQVIEFEQIEGPLIVTVWGRGVHGEQIYIHHPLTDQILFHRTSLWPLRVSEEMERLLIEVTDSGPSSDMPKEKVIILQEERLLKTLQGLLEENI